jgi:hypothetical protein
MSHTTSDDRFEAWRTLVTDALGVFAAVWGVAIGVLIVGVPIALAFALTLRLGRIIFGGL